MFAPKSDGAPQPVGHEQASAFVLDLLQISGGGRTVLGAVTADRVGRLQFTPAQPRHALPVAIQTQLQAHQVMAPQPPRTLFAPQLFLMAVEHADASASAPGLNDPVVLTGRLSGPWPRAEQTCQTPGRLTVTRADVFSAVILGAPYAFTTVGAGRSGRCFHLVLPADPAHAPGPSRVVLAYPMLPGELGVEDVVNEELTSDWLRQLLVALRDELAAAEPTHPLVNTTLPVPSRLALENQLRADGWEVNGNTASNPAARRSLLDRVASALTGAGRITLPPEASVDEFVALARVALDALPAAVRARSRAFEQAMAGRGVAGMMHTHWEPRPALRFDGPARAPATAPAAPVPPGRTTAGTPTWMSDFARSGRPAPAKAAALPSDPAAKPDWMKDFE